MIDHVAICCNTFSVEVYVIKAVEKTGAKRAAHRTKAAINNGYTDSLPSGVNGNKRFNQSFQPRI